VGKLQRRKIKWQDAPKAFCAGQKQHLPTAAWEASFSRRMLWGTASKALLKIGKETKKRRKGTWKACVGCTLGTPRDEGLPGVWYPVGRAELLQGCAKPAAGCGCCSWHSIHRLHLHRPGGGHWKAGHLRVLRERTGDGKRIIQSQRQEQSRERPACPLYSFLTSLVASSWVLSPSHTPSWCRPAHPPTPYHIHGTELYSLYSLNPHVIYG